MTTSSTTQTDAVDQYVSRLYARTFTETLPRDDGPDYPATPARIFPSVPDHAEGLDVLALIDPDQGPLFHVNGACLDADGARALVDHLEGILALTETTR